MSEAVSALLRVLDLEPLEVNLFRGRSPQTGWQRVFGGQVIGQALVAATRTGREYRGAFAARLVSCCRAIRKCRSSARSSARATARALTTSQREGDPARPADLHHDGVLP